MIQRVQSIYLLVATAFMLLFYMFPIATFVTDTFPFEFFNCHITHPENLRPPIALLPLALLPLVSIVLSMVAIFMYKRRKFQMRLGKMNMLILFIIFVSQLIYIYRIDNMLGGTIKFGFSGIFPLLTFVILIMANRAIKRDDDLVRSADRIR